MPAYIAPTYRCNLKCERCYSAKHASEFPYDLEWTSFINVCKFLDRRYSRFCIIGGEPTQWKFINEAILVLKNKNKTVTVCTNGIKPLRAFPNFLFVNTNPFWNESLQADFLKTLQKSKSKSRIILRFNIGEECTKHTIEDAVSLACRYATSVSISCLFPVKAQNEIGENIYILVKRLTSRSVKTKIARATPLCIFTPEQIQFLVKVSKLNGLCGLPSNSIYIHPDARTIQPCPELDIRMDIKSYDNGSPKDFFSKEVEYRKRRRISSCLMCNYFKNRQCCGGCLAYDLLPRRPH